MQFVCITLIPGFHFPVMESLLTLQRDNLLGCSGGARGKGQGSKKAIFLKEPKRKMALFPRFSPLPPIQETFFLTCASRNLFPFFPTRASRNSFPGRCFKKPFSRPVLRLCVKSVMLRGKGGEKKEKQGKSKGEQRQQQTILTECKARTNTRSTLPLLGATVLKEGHG